MAQALTGRFHGRTSRRRSRRRGSLLSIERFTTAVIILLTTITNYCANLFNACLTVLHNLWFYPFKPSPDDAPPANAPRIAVIGAGVTGIASAATCVKSGCDVTILEVNDRIGGIWSRTNKSSMLQTHALMYRFHPLVSFREAYPRRESILSNLERIWVMYGLRERTHFNYTVRSLRPHPVKLGSWIVNEAAVYDGVIVAIGTCGLPSISRFAGLDCFQGQAVHSSRMEELQIPENPRGYHIAVLGSGASAVEAVDYIIDRYAQDGTILSSDNLSVTIVARHNKWICPRGILISTVLAIWPVKLGFVMEWLVKRLWYGQSLKGMIPSKPLYASTPCLNTTYLELVRSGRIRYVLGNIADISQQSVSISNLQWDSFGNASWGDRLELEANAIVFATGYERPGFDFVHPKVFRKGETDPAANRKEDNSVAGRCGDESARRTEDEEGKGAYKPPNMHLMSFAPGYPTLLFLNNTFVDAVATAGHIHIGMLARTLVMHVLDPRTRPSTEEMADWVDSGRATEKEENDGEQKMWKKEKASHSYCWPCLAGGYNRWRDKGFGFVDYREFITWVAKYVLSSTQRTRWVVYISGWSYCKAKREVEKFAVAGPEVIMRGSS